MEDLTPALERTNVTIEDGNLMNPIEKRRAEAGMTYEALGEALGIGRGHAKNLCTGRHSTSPALAAKLIKLFPDLDPDEVMLAGGKFPDWAKDAARKEPAKVLKAIKKFKR